MHILLLTLQSIVVIAFLINTGVAQTLEEQISNIFRDVLELQLAGSPGSHGDHFIPARVNASEAVISTLNNFIGSSVSSFPLSSTAAGLTFDFSSGRPVSTSTSFGPIFSERSQTIGEGLFNMGFNFTAINYTKIRGVNTEDLKLAFTHQNVGSGANAILGSPAFEFDYIDFFPRMDINSSIFAFYFTYGITDELDASVAVPFVNVHIKSDPFARINSYTYLSTGQAAHQFGSDTTLPVLSKEFASLDDDATGIGDIAIRLKYNFLKNATVDMASVLEYRMATGDEKNFLGSGNDRFKLSVIASKIMGDFAPHLNVSYELRNSSSQRDRLGLFVGYDQKITETFTLALDFLGEFELGEQSKDLTFPDPLTITRLDSTYSLVVEPTNLPDFKADHLLNGAVGFKFNPRKSLMIIGNIFFPLNDGGLRSKFIPTLGAEFNF